MNARREPTPDSGLSFQTLQTTVRSRTTRQSPHDRRRSSTSNFVTPYQELATAPAPPNQGMQRTLRAPRFACALVPLMPNPLDGRRAQGRSRPSNVAGVQRLVWPAARARILTVPSIPPCLDNHIALDNGSAAPSNRPLQLSSLAPLGTPLRFAPLRSAWRPSASAPLGGAPERPPR